jgi:outer membrane protein assembly factor BamD
MFTAVQHAKKGVLMGSLVLALALSGCASNRTQGTDSESAYYDSAQQYLGNRNYSMAVERLSELQNRFPLSRFAKASALDLMYAYFEMNDYTSALVEADRFARLNPDHPDVDYAHFIRAMGYYELFLTNRGIFGKGDPAMRSPEQGVTAFSYLSQFAVQFPTSDYRPEALKAMVILKDALARHELIVADFYIRKGAWIAAAERAQVVIEHYPGVSAVGDAYVVLVEAYDALELPEDRAIALSALMESYPNHPTLASGEYVKPVWEEDRWWVKALTLGLTS